MTPGCDARFFCDMDWQDLFAALALVLVIEGILPFVSPNGLRRSYSQIVQMDDKSLRTFGLVSMIIGLLLLTVIRS